MRLSEQQLFINSLRSHIQSEYKHKERHDEMVGNNTRQQDISKRKEHYRQQTCIETTEFQRCTQYAIEEHKAVYSTESLQKWHNKNGAIDTRYIH